MDLDLSTVDVFVVGAVAGVTELIRRIAGKDWQGAAVIAASAIVGALAGALNVNGLDVASGILAGLTASGVITVISKFGHNTSPNVGVK